MTSLESRSFTVAGLRLHGFVVDKDSSLPWLLMVHGYMDHGGTFAHLVPELSKHYRLLLLDRRGYGRSASLDQGSYHFFDNLLDIAAVAKELTPEPIRIVGHSVGALFSALYAAAFPERVARLVLIDPYPILDDPESASARIRSWIRGLLGETHKTTRSYDGLAGARERLQSAHPKITEDILKTWSALGVSVDNSGQAHFLVDPRHRIRGPLSSRRETVLSMAAAITTPTLAVRGADSLVTEFPKWIDEIPQLRRETLPDSGHMLHLEVPGPFLALLHSFLP